MIIFGLFLYLTQSFPASVRGSAIGGLIALYGVVLMAWHVFFRVGVFTWIANLHFSDICGVENVGLSTDEISDREAQRKSDLMIQNVYGPYLIGVGTFINGVSGFFDYM